MLEFTLNFSKADNYQMLIIVYFSVMWLNIELKLFDLTPYQFLINSAPESPTFEAIAKVNPIGVQWKGLTLGEQPSWSPLTPVPGKYQFLIVNGKSSLNIYEF